MERGCYFLWAPPLEELREPEDDEEPREPEDEPRDEEPEDEPLEDDGLRDAPPELRDGEDPIRLPPVLRDEPLVRPDDGLETDDDEPRDDVPE